MKNIKKILSLTLAILMIAGMFAGCGDKKVEMNADGTTVQGKTAIVNYNSSGYGHTWLEKAAEAFEQMYAEEGYQIELEITYGVQDTATLEIG